MLNLEAATDVASSHGVATGHAFASHHPEGLDAHLSSGSVRLTRTKEHIFTAGDTRTHVYRVESGSVCLYKIMPDGRRQVIDFAYVGDYVGLGTRREHTCNAQAMEPVRLKCIPVSTLTRTASRDPELGLKLYEAISEELAAAQDHLFTIGQRSAVERMACFLLALSRRAHGRGKVASTLVLPMTRLDIADFLGLTIETVSRTLTKLKTAKLIELEQCTIVRLLDPARLEELAAGETGM